jgi:hypothetical protein
MDTLPIKIVLFYDSDCYAREDAEAFCAALPPEVDFDCAPVLRNAGSAPPGLFWQVDGGLMQLGVLACGFSDELGRSLDKGIGNDVVGAYRLLLDRLLQLIGRLTNPLPADFIIWTGEERPRQFEFSVHLRHLEDVDQMLAALSAGVRIAERLLEEYRDRTLHQAKLRFDTWTHTWFVDFQHVDGHLIAREHVQTDQPAREPPEASP